MNFPHHSIFLNWPCKDCAQSSPADALPSAPTSAPCVPIKPLGVVLIPLSWIALLLGLPLLVISSGLLLIGFAKCMVRPTKCAGDAMPNLFFIPPFPLVSLMDCLVVGSTSSLYFKWLAPNWLCKVHGKANEMCGRCHAQPFFYTSFPPRVTFGTGISCKFPLSDLM